jgi:hypothetical protein
MAISLLLAREPEKAYICAANKQLQYSFREVGVTGLVFRQLGHKKGDSMREICRHWLNAETTLAYHAALRFP